MRGPHACSNPCGTCLHDEVVRLRHWKTEATTVIDWWEDVWRALGEPGQLGDFRSKACLTEIERLRADLDELREANERLRHALLDHAVVGRSRR